MLVCRIGKRKTIVRDVGLRNASVVDDHLVRNCRERHASDSLAACRHRDADRAFIVSRSYHDGDLDPCVSGVLNGYGNDIIRF